MSKAQYIGNYLDRKMKHNQLEYGMGYFILLEHLEVRAEKMWINYLNKEKK